MAWEERGGDEREGGSRGCGGRIEQGSIPSPLSLLNARKPLPPSSIGTKLVRGSKEPSPPSMGRSIEGAVCRRKASEQLPVGAAAARRGPPHEGAAGDDDARVELDVDGQPVVDEGGGGDGELAGDVEEHAESSRGVGEGGWVGRGREDGGRAAWVDGWTDGWTRETMEANQQDERKTIQKRVHGEFAHSCKRRQRNSPLELPLTLYSSSLILHLIEAPQTPCFHHPMITHPSDVL